MFGDILCNFSLQPILSASEQAFPANLASGHVKTVYLQHLHILFYISIRHLLCLLECFCLGVFGSSE